MHAFPVRLCTSFLSNEYIMSQSKSSIKERVVLGELILGENYYMLWRQFIVRLQGQYES